MTGAPFHLANSCKWEAHCLECAKLYIEEGTGNLKIEPLLRHGVAEIFYPWRGSPAINDVRRIKLNFTRIRVINEETGELESREHFFFGDCVNGVVTELFAYEHEDHGARIDSFERQYWPYCFHDPSFDRQHGLDWSTGLGEVEFVGKILKKTRARGGPRRTIQ